MLKRLLPCAFFFLVLLLISPTAFAAEEPQTVPLTVSGQGYDDFSFLNDRDDYYYYTSYWGCTLTLESQTPFSSLYLMFDLEYGAYTITDNTTGQTTQAGQYSFLHEYVPLSQPTTSVTVTFPNGPVRLSEITAYTEGTPTDIQIWSPPLEGETELLLLSTHGDDEQLYFAGLLPLYAGERGYKVQVAYLTDHRNLTYERTHEMLNGLWAVGVRNYPVFGSFADFRIDSLQRTYTRYAQLGTSRYSLLEYVVTLIRRFDPQVVVGHDFAGEYGHGMHRVYADLLAEAITISNDPAQYPEVAKKYGVWQVSKAYFHLYQENPIVLDYDVPLASFNGMTAFDVTRKLGFPCHITQQNSTDFGQWVNGEYSEVKKASQIVKYNPCHFGLYYSNVGPDVEKNDFMENTPGYILRKEQEAERLAREEAEREEAEREEAQRQEEERRSQEEEDRKAEERKRLEEKRIAEEKEAQRQEQQKLTLFIIILGIVLTSVGMTAVLTRLLRPKKKNNAQE